MVSRSVLKSQQVFQRELREIRAFVVVKFFTWVTVTGGGMAQYSDEVIVFVVVTLFTWVTVTGGGIAQYPDDMIVLVEVKVIVPGGYAPYVGGGAS